MYYETIEVLGGATFVLLTFGHMRLRDFSSTNNKNKRYLCHLVETHGRKDGPTDRWDRSGGQGAKPSVKGWKYSMLGDESQPV